LRDHLANQNSTLSMNWRTCSGISRFFLTTTASSRVNRLGHASRVGRYYVGSSCIDCDLYRTTAPAFFNRNDEIGLSIVHFQPVTPNELALAEEAREGCPSESIGTTEINKLPAHSAGNRAQT
jgi:ferredoxin